MNVVALGDHLRAYEQIDFACIHAGESALEIFAAADGVAIQSPNAGLGKQAMQQFFELL